MLHFYTRKQGSFYFKRIAISRRLQSSRVNNSRAIKRAQEVCETRATTPCGASSSSSSSSPAAIVGGKRQDDESECTRAIGSREENRERERERERDKRERDDSARSELINRPASSRFRPVPSRHQHRQLLRLLLRCLRFYVIYKRVFIIVPSRGSLLSSPAATLCTSQPSSFSLFCYISSRCALCIKKERESGARSSRACARYQCSTNQQSI